MDILRRYRQWKWRHLGLLGPAFGVSLWATVWLAWMAPGTAGIRFACLSIAGLLTSLQGFFLLQTLLCDRLHRKLESEGARPLRREIKPYRGVAAVSVLMMAILAWVPGMFPQRPVESPRLLSVRRSWVQASQRAPLDPHRPPDDSKGQEAKGPVEPVIVRDPAIPAAMPIRPSAPEIRPILALEPQPLDGAGPVPPVLPIPAEPEIRPILAMDPQPLESTLKDLILAVWPESPSAVSQESPVPDQSREPEGPLPPVRASLEDIREAALARERVLGTLVRAVPDEIDRDAWPDPEMRLDGLILFGHDYGKAPALTMALDFPVGSYDSLEAGWFAVNMPRADDTHDHHDLPDWNQLTLNYTRRLAGYTRHALFDLSVSVGACVEFFGPLKGLAVEDRDPQLAPYVAVDMAIWQKGALGLLVHAGEAIPVAIGGSSVGVTDLAGLVRLDVSPQVSLHLGYRYLTLRFKETSSLVPPGVPNQALDESLAGPMVGVDLRF